MAEAAEVITEGDGQIHLPHETSTIYRRALRTVENEEEWQHAGAVFTDFFSPKEDIFDIYESGLWAIDHWVVDGLIRARSNCLMAGESNVGKTYLALDLAISIASGERFLNHFDCDIGPVIYIGGEGDKELLVRRINNILMGRGIDPAPWFKKYRKLLTLSLPPDYAARYPVPLANKDYQNALMEKMYSQAKKLRPRAFIWDPLSALVPDVDKDPNNVQAVINFLKMLNKECDAASFVLHHPKKKQTNGPEDRRSMIRGESSWISFADDVIYVDGDKEQDNLVHFWGNKARDGVAPGDTEAMFSARKSFEDVENPPAFASPGALKKACFTYVPHQRRVVKDDEKGRRKKEEDGAVAISPRSGHIQQTMNEIMKVMRGAQKPLERRDIRNALGDSVDLTFDEAFGQLLSNQLIWSGRTDCEVLYFVNKGE